MFSVAVSFAFISHDLHHHSFLLLRSDSSCCAPDQQAPPAVRLIGARNPAQTMLSNELHDVLDRLASAHCLANALNRTASETVINEVS
jgi:hypothetical protein